MTLNLIIAATLGALYGIVQGMCMVKPIDKMHKGNWIDYFPYDPSEECDKLYRWLRQFNLGLRSHRWFRYWHLIFGAFCFALATWIAVIVVGLVIQALPQFPIREAIWWFKYIPVIEPSTLCLQLLVIWMFVEPCYNLTRYGKLIPPDGMENVTLWDLKVRIPWIHKITWTEIEKADRPTHEVSAYNNTMTVSVYSTEEWEVEKSKWGWHTIQILPFHAKSWVMHALRIGAIICLFVINAVLI